MPASTMSTTTAVLKITGLPPGQHIHYQLPPAALIRQTLQRGEGVLNDTGALIICTGEFTGRSPDDKFIVQDELTVASIDWNSFNNPIDPVCFDRLYNKMLGYFNNREMWVRDCYACADAAYRLPVRVINENPWSNLFAYNMFLKPEEETAENFDTGWQVLHAPDFKAVPAIDGTRHSNFTVINFAKKTILIGGSAYTGEIKKGIFSVLNYLLPGKGVLSMHCAANTGKAGDTALFFGLSGTGKTTLSADPGRYLVGDDEHGWTNDSIFNFEGGCYAKTIDLDEEKEPAIFRAIRYGALVENVTFIEGSNRIDFTSKKITQNTRVSYPIRFISNALPASVGKTPKNIFFLTCDSYGILPPLGRLTTAQAMYYYMSGYTAKIAGTETGITEPKATFSACFGAPFLPLHPGRYAGLLGKKIAAGNVTVWMINTGWSGGAYGTGNRISIDYTRTMVTAVLTDMLRDIPFSPHPVFGIGVPERCPGVPAEILNPENTWPDKEAYKIKSKQLARLFIENFEKFKAFVSVEILNAGPKL